MLSSGGCVKFMSSRSSSLPSSSAALTRFCSTHFVDCNLYKRSVYSYLWKSISQLRSVTCRMGSHSVTFHLTQANTPRLYPSQTGWYSIYQPFKDGGLSKPSPRVQRATGPQLLRDSPWPARTHDLAIASRAR